MSSAALAAGHNVLENVMIYKALARRFLAEIAALRPESSKALRFPYKRRRQMTFSGISCLLARFVARV